MANLDTEREILTLEGEEIHHLFQAISELQEGVDRLNDDRLAKDPTVQRALDNLVEAQHRLALLVA